MLTTTISLHHPELFLGTWQAAWARIPQSPLISIWPSSQTLSNVHKYNKLTKIVKLELPYFWKFCVKDNPSLQMSITQALFWNPFKLFIKNKEVVRRWSYLCDGDSLPGFGWWSICQTLSEQHCDLLQLLLSLLHIGVLLQHLLQVRATCQIILVEGDTIYGF